MAFPEVNQVEARDEVGAMGEAGAVSEAGAADILPGQLIDLAPWSALVFEKKQ